ncbi:MAG: hypothetical protein J1F66_04435 [Clostridiales bacterium]|nr:hypothetical protein [Clostridiales bacterium]
MNAIKNFFAKLKSIKNIEIYIALILAVVVILLVFAGNGAKNTSKTVEDDTYIDEMEHKICNVIQKIDGCGKAEVAISYDGDEYVIGVVVVAEGANDPIIRFKIVEVVVTLLDVDSTSVSVFTYKS